MIKRLFFALVLLSFSPAIAQAEAQQWKLDTQKSIIAWEAYYGAQPVQGSFNAITGDIAFDPDNLAGSKIKIVIDLTKINTDENNAKTMLPGKEWFNTAQYPVATIETETIKAVEGQSGDKKLYNATANVTIRGKTVPINLGFTLAFSKDHKNSIAEGDTTLKRLDFDIGSGEWKDTSIIADEVKIHFHMEAQAK